METQKIIKKYGSSNVIILSNEELKILSAKVGDIVKIKVEVLK